MEKATFPAQENPGPGSEEWCDNTQSCTGSHCQVTWRYQSTHGYSSNFRQPKPLPKTVTAFSKIAKNSPNIIPISSWARCIHVFFSLSVTWLVWWKAIQNETQIAFKKAIWHQKGDVHKEHWDALTKAFLATWLWPWKHADAKPCDVAACSFKPFLFDLLLGESERLFSLFKTQGPA